MKQIADSARIHSSAMFFWVCVYIASAPHFGWHRRRRVSDADVIVKFFGHTIVFVLVDRRPNAIPDADSHGKKLLAPAAVAVAATTAVTCGFVVRDAAAFISSCGICMHSSCLSGCGIAVQSMNFGHNSSSTESVRQSALTVSHSDRHAVTGWETSGEHSGNSDAHVRKRACGEHFASSSGSNWLSCKKRIKDVFIIKWNIFFFFEN